MPWRPWKRRLREWSWKRRRRGDIHWNGHQSKAIILVKDTLQALGDLARERRRRYQTPVVALTGSNGKTTSKEMIAACLETTFPVLKNRGNWNNLIGLPLTLLRLTEKERVVVLEMGMNVPGEIRRLTEIAEPDVGLITNIQKVHLEGLGSLERLKEEKGELFRRMKRDGTIVVNQDDARVVDLAEEFPGQKITFGIEEPSDVMAREIRLRGIEGTSFTLVFEGEETEITLPLLGRHFVPDALSAIAISALFGIDLEKVKEVLEHFRPAPMRMEVVSLGEREDADQRCLQRQSEIDGDGLGDPGRGEGRGQGDRCFGRYAGAWKSLRKRPICSWEERLESFRSTSSLRWESGLLWWSSQRSATGLSRRGPRSWRATGRPSPS